MALSIRLPSYQTLNDDPPARERPNNRCLPKAQWVRHKPIKISLFGAMTVSADVGHAREGISRYLIGCCLTLLGLLGFGVIWQHETECSITYQTLKKEIKHNAQRSIFDKIRGDGCCDETLFECLIQFYRQNNFEEEIKDAKTSFSADTRTRHGQRGVPRPSLVALHAFLWNTSDFMSGINLNLLGSYYMVKKIVSLQPIVSSRYLPKIDKMIKITVNLPLNHV